MRIMQLMILYLLFVFFFNDTATTEIYTLSLHDALPISGAVLDHDRLPEQLAKARLHDASDEVRRAARREGDEHANRAGGITLREGQGRKKQYEKKLHSELIGKGTARFNRAERSNALVSISRLCASAAVACCVGSPIEMRFSHCSASSRIGPRSPPRAMSPGGGA